MLVKCRKLNLLLEVVSIAMLIQKNINHLKQLNYNGANCKKTLQISLIGNCMQIPFKCCMRTWFGILHEFLVYAFYL